MKASFQNLILLISSFLSMCSLKESHKDATLQNQINTTDFIGKWSIDRSLKSHFDFSKLKDSLPTLQLENNTRFLAKHIPHALFDKNWNDNDYKTLLHKGNWKFDSDNSRDFLILKFDSTPNYPHGFAKRGMIRRVKGKMYLMFYVGDPDADEVLAFSREDKIPN